MFFEDVRVPVDNRIGEENKGWTYAKYLLEFERGNAYAPGLSPSGRSERSPRKPDERRAADRGTGFRCRLAQVEIDAKAIEIWSCSPPARGTRPGAVPPC